MTELTENLYNQKRTRTEPKMKIWSYAGLLLTYRCNARCGFCYYCCGPDSGGLLETEAALNAWQSLRRLAGGSAKVHLTGGEPFLYYEHLADLLSKAHKMGLTPLDSLETNGFWATDESLIRQRLKFLDANGLDRLKISWDVFHAEFIDPELVRRLAGLAGQILGSGRVLVRWQRYLDNPIDTPLSEKTRQSSFTEALRQDHCRFTGRAAGLLAGFVPSKPAESFAGQDCRAAILSARGVHIDPYGNVFSGQCGGICAGNINQNPLEEIWRNFDPSGMEFWSILFERGPCGLLEQARTAGYAPLPGYASRCHLCYHLRRFFFDKGAFTSIIRPKDCYQD